MDRDLKVANIELQKRIKQSNEELLQTRARQSQEIMNLRDEIPALAGKLDEAVHHAKELERRQEDLHVRLSAHDSKFEKRLNDNDKRAAENEKRVAEESRRLSWAEQQLVNQEQKMDADRKHAKSEVAALNAGIEQLRGHIDTEQSRSGSKNELSTRTKGGQPAGRTAKDDPCRRDSPGRPRSSRGAEQDVERTSGKTESSAWRIQSGPEQDR
jgi:DNA repair exonuclease SbcCD ATPase subunit